MIGKYINVIFGQKTQKQSLSKDSFCIDPGVNITYSPNSSITGSGTFYSNASGTFRVFDMGPPGDYDLGCKDENLEVKNDAIISNN